MAKKKAAGTKGAGKKSASSRTIAGNSVARSPAAQPKTTGGVWDAVFAPRAPGERRYWLVKSEPEVFSFDDLLRIQSKTTHWNGIRNFVARNFLKDGMKPGDRAFFYHSGSAPGIVGICEVVREGYPDDSAFDPAGEGYDPKSDKSAPTWYMVDLRAVAQLTHPVTLAQIKERKELADMVILRIGRLSVTPVSAAEWEVICRMAG